MNNGFTTYERQSDCGPTAGNGAAYSAIINAATLSGDPMTERSKRIWSAGDYDRISAGFRHEAQALVQRVSLTSGMQVLDAACGSGNLTIPAGRTGACVTGFDLVASLLDATAVWAARESLNITLDQGNVEELPYGDAQFDVVMSMLGIMFA